MSDTYWLLGRGAGNKAIPIDYTSQANPWPTPERGRADTYDCRFVPSPTTDYGALATPALTGHKARYAAVRDYLTYANAAQVISTDPLIGSGVTYHERQSALDPVETHFVGVAPPDAIDVEPFYAVVSGGAITKTAPNARLQLDLELTYLGPQSDWPTRAIARENLEA